MRLGDCVVARLCWCPVVRSCASAVVRLCSSAVAYSWAAVLVRLYKCVVVRFAVVQMCGGRCTVARFKLCGCAAVVVRWCLLCLRGGWPRPRVANGADSLASLSLAVGVSLAAPRSFPAPAALLLPGPASLSGFHTRACFPVEPGAARCACNLCCINLASYCRGPLPFSTLNVVLARVLAQWGFGFPFFRLFFRVLPPYLARV